MRRRKREGAALEGVTNCYARDGLDAGYLRPWYIAVHGYRSTVVPISSLEQNEGFRTVTDLRYPNATVRPRRRAAIGAQHRR